MSTVQSIANSVQAALLQARSALSLPVQVERQYLPTEDLATLKDILGTDQYGVLVTILPRSNSAELYSRSQRLCEFGVDVVIQCKLQEDDQTTQLDNLLQLVDEIDAYLFANPVIEKFAFPLGPPPGLAQWIKAANDPIYLPVHLEQYSQFTSVLKLTYRNVQ